MSIFLPRPFSSVRDPVWDLWQKYIAFTGKDKFTWARLGGGNRSRAVDASTFRTIASWLTGKKSPGKDCWISIHDGPMDCLGKHSFELEGLGEPNTGQEDVSYIDIGFPVDLLETLGGQKVADRFVDLVAKVPFYCGMAGFIFHRSPYKFNAVIKQMAALSRRYEGVEVSASQREQYWAEKGLVSVNWITLLGNDLLKKLGGSESVQRKLPSGCRVTVVEHGIVIRAGDSPLLGDRNTGKDELGLWRDVYKVVKPVQFIDTAYEFNAFEFDGQRTAEWLRRLDS